MPKFHAAHYNMVAARLREAFPIDLAPMTEQYDNGRRDNMVRRGVIVDLALSFAKTFQKDNALFDPLKFLTDVSPHPDVYPLSEFWEDYNDSCKN